MGSSASAVRLRKERAIDTRKLAPVIWLFDGAGQQVEVRRSDLEAPFCDFDEAMLRAILWVDPLATATR